MLTRKKKTHKVTTCFNTKESVPLLKKTNCYYYSYSYRKKKKEKTARERRSLTASIYRFCLHRKTESAVNLGFP